MISDATAQGRAGWNLFVREHYPPIGAFMQTWEWGEFQKALGRKVERFFVGTSRKPDASFMLVHYALPMGYSYGYIPRGPVMARHAAGEEVSLGVFESIKQWAQKHLPHLLFLRLEPPLEAIAPEAAKRGFSTPEYYVQPRYNLAVSLSVTEEEILSGFHPSTRSNIRRAQNRGVTVKTKPKMAEADYQQFFSMTQDTIKRNSGTNAYPDPLYFRALVNSIPVLAEKYDSEKLSLGIFYGYQNGEPAALHFVLFFGDTATYLYGASYTSRLSSKVTTYLHWAAMQEAKKRGLKFYDLGGIDEQRWPTLTNFKRQFRGREFSYVGNVDIPIRPALYKSYNVFKKFR